MAYAPMVELYAIGHHVLHRGHVQPGETVAILGSGKVGLSILDVLCHSASPALVICTDIHTHRLQVARELGADHVVDIEEQDPIEYVMELTNGVGIDCAIEAVGHYHTISGQQSPLSQAVQMIRNGGRVVTVGLGEQWSPVHFKTLVIKEAEIIASRVTQGEFPRAIRLLSKGLLHPDRMITHQMAIREAAKAFATVDREDAETLKVVLDIRQW